MSEKTLSYSPEERENKLKKAHLLTKTLKYVSLVIVFWAIKFPRPYEYVLIACLIMPIIGIIVFRFGNGLIKIEINRDSQNPNLLPVFLPGLIFACRSKFDFYIDNFSNVWLLVVIFTIVLSALFFVLNQKILQIENWYRGKIRILFFSFVYSYGAVIGINCVFDKSKPKIFTSKLYDKRASIMVTERYDIEVSSWKNNSETEKLSIDGIPNDQLKVGENVSIYVFQGLFNIPWVEAGRDRLK